ncbi:HAD family hydrolase [Chloroflexota bacterium]
MVKAVFFDWFNTVAHYDPPREELQSQVLQEFGINVSPQKLFRGILIADRNIYEENAEFPLRERSPEEQAKIYTRYQETVLTEAGVDVSGEPEMPLKTMKRMQQLSRGMRFVLFDDVLSTMKTLKERALILGLLTNLDKDMRPLSREVGLEPYIDFTVTSGEVGVDKPKPLIFLAALEKAGVNASEAVHVGDQYKLDILGARGVGITPILIDRYDSYPEVNDCPRIHSLTEVIQYLQLNPD